MNQLSEREFERQFQETLRAAFGDAQATIANQVPINFENGIRRWLDFLLDIRDRTYIFEIKRFTGSPSIISEQYFRARAVAEELVFSRQLHGRRVYFVLVFSNVSRSEYSNLRETEPIFDRTSKVPQDISLVFSDEALNPELLQSRLLDAPPLSMIGRDRTSRSTGSLQHALFISYRRFDSGWAAGRIADYLQAKFDRSDVFFDTRSIELGDDIDEVIRERINSSNILVALIGRSWLTIRDKESGRRRLDDPNDVVRLEIALALKNNLLVIPLLVDGAKMPREEYLPDDLKSLTTKLAGRIALDNFAVEVERLEKRLLKAGMRHRR